MPDIGMITTYERRPDEIVQRRIEVDSPKVASLHSKFQVEKLSSIAAAMDEHSISRSAVRTLAAIEPALPRPHAVEELVRAQTFAMAKKMPIVKIPDVRRS